MANLNLDKITIYPGINDLPTQANAQEGCNGAWLVKAINNLIDEVNILKSQPSGSSANFQISASGTASEEFSYINIITAADYDGTILSIYIENSDYFYDFYLEVNGQFRGLSYTPEPDIFTIDEPNFMAGDSIDLVIVFDEIQVLEGYSESVSLILDGTFATASTAPVNQP